VFSVDMAFPVTCQTVTRLVSRLTGTLGGREQDYDQVDVKL